MESDVAMIVSLVGLAFLQQQFAIALRKIAQLQNSRVGLLNRQAVDGFRYGLRSRGLPAQRDRRVGCQCRDPSPNGIHASTIDSDQTLI